MVQCNKSTIGCFTLGFALTATYCPQIAGAATTPRWAVMAISTLALPFMPGSKPGITWAHIAGLAFLAYATASLAWSPTLDTHDALLKLAILAGMFLIGGHVTDLMALWIGAALGLYLSSAMVAAEALGLVSALSIPRSIGLFYNGGLPAGLFVNGLYLAEAAALVIVGLVASGRWRWAVPLAPCILLLGQVPRGPIVALLVAWIAWGMARNRHPGLVGCAALLAAAMAATAWLRPETVSLRLSMWSDALRATTFFGHGYGSYHAVIPFHSVAYDAAKYVEIAPHNEAIGVLFELGLPGLFLAVAFCAIVLCAPLVRPLSPPASTQPSWLAGRIVLIAFLTEAMFGFGFHLPVTAGLFALTAGHISRGLPHWSVTFARRRSALRTRNESNRFAGILGPSIASRGDIPIHFAIPDSAGQAAIRARQTDAGADTGRHDGA